MKKSTTYFVVVQGRRYFRWSGKADPSDERDRTLEKQSQLPHPSRSCSNSHRHLLDLVSTLSLLLFTAFLEGLVLPLIIWFPVSRGRELSARCLSRPVRLFLPMTPGLALQKSMLCPFLKERNFERRVIAFSYALYPYKFVHLFVHLFSHLFIPLLNTCYCCNPISTSLEGKGWLVNRRGRSPWGPLQDPGGAWPSFLSDWTPVLCTCPSSCFMFSRQVTL